MRCRGYRPVEIYPMIAREFSVSERQANDDVTAANKLIAEGLQNVLEHEATMGLEFLTEVKREAIESGSLGDAVRAQQEINKMLGNHAATRVEHSGTVGVAPDLSGLPPEKRKLLLELVEGDEG